jgi:hypothetical protein
MSLLLLATNQHQFSLFLQVADQFGPQNISNFGLTRDQGSVAVMQVVSYEVTTSRRCHPRPPEAGAC